MSAVKDVMRGKSDHVLPICVGDKMGYISSEERWGVPFERGKKRKEGKIKKDWASFTGVTGSFGW